MVIRVVTIALIAVAIALPIGLMNAGRYAASQVRVTAMNHAERAHTLRVTDSLTDRAIAVVQVEPGRRSVIFDGRLEPWWVDEDPGGARRELSIETLSSSCELLGRTELHQPQELWIDPDGSIAYTGYDAGDPALSDRSVAAAVDDPCGGKPGTPRGVVINRTEVAVQVHAGLVLAPCTERVVHPGDLVPWDGPSPTPPPGVVSVVIREIEAQDERWPRSPTTVLISADWTSVGAGMSELDDYGPCLGRPAPEELP